MMPETKQIGNWLSTATRRERGQKPTSPAGPGTRPKTGYRDCLRFPCWSRQAAGRVKDPHGRGNKENRIKKITQQ